MKAVGHSAASVALAISLDFVMAGCGGAGLTQVTAPPLRPTAVIFVAQPPTSLAVNATATVDAAAIYPVNSVGNADTQVAYSVSCGTTNGCGTLGPSDEGGAATYTAPASVPSGGTVTLTATSVVDTTLSKSAIIKIVPPIPITVSFFGAPPASVVVSSQVSLRAQINNDVSANPMVNWSLSCGQADCGTLAPLSTPSEEPTTFTAPASIPPGNTVTIPATSITDPTKSTTATIVIMAAGPTLADGTYVFQQTSDTEVITGLIVAKAGAITTGEQDAILNDSDDGPYSSFQTITGGSYANTADGNVQLSIQLGVNDTETITGTLASGGRGFVSGVDGVPGSTTLELQSSAAAPSGGYAIALDAGAPFNSSPSLAGILNINGPGTISGAGSILDLQQTYIGGSQTIASSTVSPPDAYGRVMFQLNPTANSPLQTLFIAGYIVDATHIRLIPSGDPQNSYTVLGEMAGLALGQGADAGKFNANSVAGSTYVIGAAGSDQRGTLQLAGLLKLNPGGTASGSLNWNDLSAGSSQSPVAFTASYAVDPTGRITISNLTDGANFNYSLHLYVDGNGGGLILSNDTYDVFAGRAFLQKSTAFNAASFNGQYGLNAGLYALPQDLVPTTGMAEGRFTSTANANVDTVAGYADVGYGGQDFALAGTFAPDSSGIFTGTLTGFDGVISGFDGASPATSNNFTLYMIDTTQAVLIETDDAQLLLGRVEIAP